MFAVERLGSYITRGVNTVSGPFHPFGGAVDIVVVEQQDGTFKSSPWYVRFGKFQGVLKAKEKVVSISVDGVEADFHMYLDHRGVAYFLRELDADEVDSSLLWPSSSGEEADGQYRDRRTVKSKSCNYDAGQSNLVTKIDVSNGKVVARTNSRRSKILGLVFGRKSMKEGSRVGDEDGAGVVRTDSLDRAEIAADLLEVRWSTNLACGRLGKDDAPRFFDSNISQCVANKDWEISNNSTNSLDNLSWSSFQKLERPVEETGVEMLCIGKSALIESGDEGNNELNYETPRNIDRIGVTNVDPDENSKNFESEIFLDHEHAYEEDNGVLLKAGVLEGNGSDRVEAIIYCDTSERSRIVSDVLGEQANETLYLSCGKCGDIKLCAETLHERTELISESEGNSSAASSIETETYSELVTVAPLNGSAKVTISSIRNSTCVGQDEKIPCEEDEVNKLGPSFEPVCDSQEINCDFVPSKVSNVPEEEQFQFSDGDDFKVREVKCTESISLDHVEDENPLTDVEELRQEPKTTSSNVNIPRRGEVATEEVGRMVKSLPNKQSRFDELDEHRLHPLSAHSLDSNSKSSKWMVIRKDLSNCVKLARDEEHQLFISKPTTEDALIPEELKNAPATPETGYPSEIIDSSSGSWGLWPFRRSRSFKSSLSAGIPTGDLNAENAFESNSTMDVENDVHNPVVNKKKIRATTPTSEQLASLNLKEGRNVVTFTFSTAMLGEQQVDARIYLWRWDTRIVISDVDGTITKSDLLGQFMPLVGKDWSQTGVAHLFSAIKENGYQMLFLSARAISQAYHTRQFLFNLKQDGKALPDGPVVISPDGLFPSLFREVIRRAPHEFKIACLEDIKALFPADRNPFYAGFGNRHTDEFSYLKVGIPKGKIFIINPKGEVVVNRRVDSKSYTSLQALVNDMFPPMTSSEPEDFNSWNYWKLPPPDISC
ncbi:hypothetical protein LguiA_006661 [Lonicera macranthoides]